MSVVLTVSALFGCGGSGKYTVDDIISFHTSYYGMASNPVYAFALRKQDENWLFSASCNLKSREDYYTSFSSFPIPTEEAEKSLRSSVRKARSSGCGNTAIRYASST